MRAPAKDLVGGGLGVGEPALPAQWTSAIFPDKPGTVITMSQWVKFILVVMGRGKELCRGRKGRKAPTQKQRGKGREKSLRARSIYLFCPMHFNHILSSSEAMYTRDLCSLSLLCMPRWRPFWLKCFGPNKLVFHAPGRFASFHGGAKNNKAKPLLPSPIASKLALSNPYSGLFSEYWGFKVLKFHT